MRDVLSDAIKPPPPHERRLLRARLVSYGMFLVTATALIAGGYWHYRVETKRMMTSHVATLMAVHQLKAHQLESWYRERLQDLKWFAQRKRHEAKIPLVMEAGDCRKLDGAVGIVCFSSDGKFLDACPQGLEIGQATTQAVLQAVAQQRHGASVFFTGRDGGLLVDIVCDAVDGHLWVARYPVEQEFLRPLTVNLNANQRGDSYLVQADHGTPQLVMPVRHGVSSFERFSGGIGQHDCTAARALRGEQGIREGVNFRSEQVISAMRRIESTPWFLITEIHRDEVMSGLPEQATLTAGTTLCMIGFAGFGITRLQRLRQRILQRQLDDFQGHQLAASAYQHDILQTAMDGFCVLDERGCIRDANAAYQHMSGYTLDELRGMRISDLEALETSEQVEQHIQKIRECGQDRFESAHRKKDGSVMQVEVSVQYRPEYGWQVVFVRDITERKQLESEVQQALEQAMMASRAKGEFLAVMSHELRTPLNSVLGFAELLEGTPLSPEQQEYLRHIRHSGGHLLQHVADILDFISLGSSGTPTETAPFCVAELCRELLPGADRQNATLPFQPVLLELGQSVPAWVVGDRKRLQRILAQLIDNALKFGGTGEIRLKVAESARHGAGWLEFVVSDQGIGVSPQQSERIFEPFFQGDSARNRKHDGVGLGLAIGRKLAETMGGTLTVVEPESPGARFQLDLPLPATDPHGVDRLDMLQVDDQPEKPSPAPLGAGRILVAEDDPINFRLASMFLRLLGYQTDWAKHGQEAVELFQAHHYDAILMDVQMPVLDGIQAAREIRARERGRRTPMIALTANVLPEDREACREAGMDGFIAKPFKKEDLRRALELVFARDGDSETVCENAFPATKKVED